MLIDWDTLLISENIQTKANHRIILKQILTIKNAETIGTTTITFKVLNNSKNDLRSWTSEPKWNGLFRRRIVHWAGSTTKVNFRLRYRRHILLWTAYKQAIWNNGLYTCSLQEKPCSPRWTPVIVNYSASCFKIYRIFLKTI